MMPTVLNGAGAEQTKEEVEEEEGDVSKQGSGARVVKTMLGIFTSCCSDING